MILKYEFIRFCFFTDELYGLQNVPAVVVLLEEHTALGQMLLVESLHLLVQEIALLYRLLIGDV